MNPNRHVETGLRRTTADTQYVEEVVADHLFPSRRLQRDRRDFLRRRALGEDIPLEMAVSSAVGSHACSAIAYNPSRTLEPSPAEAEKALEALREKVENAYRDGPVLPLVETGDFTLIEAMPTLAA